MPIGRSRMVILGWAGPACLASLAVSLFAISTRKGLAFTPDSWASWEGSVSLLEGCGWRYVGGPPITDWPPLFTWYLTAVQVLLGQQVLALVVACAILLALSVAGWTRLALRSHTSRDTLSAAAAIYIALFLIPWYSVLLSELLAIALLPWLLAEILDAVKNRSIPRLQLVRVTLLLGALLLTRHVSLALVPPTVLILMAAIHDTRSRVAILVAAIVSVGLWRLVNWMLGLPTEARLEWAGLASSLPARAMQVASGSGWLLATTRWGLDRWAVGMVGISIAIAITLRRTSSLPWIVVRTLMSFVAASILCLIVLITLTNPVDLLGGRFLLHLVPILAIVVAVVGSHAPIRWGRRVATLTLVLLIAFQATRVGTLVWEGRWDAWGLVLSPAAKLSATRIGGPNFVTPPHFPWISRVPPSVGCSP